MLLTGGNPQIAKAEGDAPVKAYLAGMPGWKRDVGRRLDALIVRTFPDVRKAIKWNSPFYGIEGQGWFLAVPFEAGEAQTMRYLIVIEETATGYSAYSPDVPGCVATGGTRDEVEAQMKDAISFHLDGLKEEGMSLPEPRTSSSYVEVPV